MTLLPRFPKRTDPRSFQFLQPVLPGVTQIFALVLLVFSGSMALFGQLATSAPQNGVATQSSYIARKFSKPSIAAGAPAAKRQPPQTPSQPVPAGMPVASLASTLTFYDCVDQGFCGAMYNGEPVYEGAAACSWDLAIGTQFFIPGDPTGRLYVCKDRGLLPDTHVDIFWHHPDDGWRWQAVVGSLGTIDIVEPLPAPLPPPSGP